MPKLLIFDFDGTMTNAEAEGQPYRTGYLEDLALICNLSLETIFQWADEFDQHVSENQGAFGWKFNGHIVAPAGVDPYLRIMPTARLILDRAGVLTSPDIRDRILDRILYKYNYSKTHTVFHNEAAPLIHHLYNNEKFECYVVTNSHTEPVQNKLRLLQSQNPELHIDWLTPKVYGSARKYIIEPMDNTPERIEVSGLDRPILLHRAHYHRVLNKLAQAHHIDWEDIIVIGDIFELDLSLPLALGANVGLLRSKFTPEYEQRFLDAHPRGRTFMDLNQVGQYLNQLC